MERSTEGSFVRWLLRRVARGLPIAGVGAASLLGGCWNTGSGSCPEPIGSTRHPATPELIERHAVTPCDDLCHALDAIRVDAGPNDGELPDGSVLTQRNPMFYYAEASCELTGSELVCTYRPICIGGRAPDGLEPPSAVPGSSAAGRWLADAAHLERASVEAFEELARELAAYGAPAALVTAARAAADDERRHAALVTRLARAYGARVAPVRRRRAGIRTLAAIATENATEGCVREAFGALSAAHQAERAEDPHARRVYAEIARDEARHALFSLELSTWASARLDDRDRDRVEAARRSALEAFRAELSVEPDATASALGLPSARWSLAACAALAA